MQRLLCIGLLFGCFSPRLPAQLSGTVSVPGSYTSVAAAVSDLNLNGVSGPMTVYVAAGFTETAITGGYTLSASGSASAPIVFKKQGTGSNPLIFAYPGGNKTPGSASQDGLWRLAGSDYVTIDGIDLFDPNTTNPSTMEFGYGLFKLNGNDGCQHVTIRNCVISLRRGNNSAGSGSSSDGSRGIEAVNATMSAHNAAVTVLSAAGAHSFNHFYGNQVQNCNFGIVLIGFAGAPGSGLCDTGNEVGGATAVTGNKIINFGGGGTYSGAGGIRTLAQYDLQISHNIINSNTGQGSNHQSTLRAVYLNTAPSANATVENNTITVHGGGTGSQLTCIENVAGSGGTTNTIVIRNNLLVNSTYTNAINGPFYGIWNSGSPQTLSITGNMLHNNASGASGGSTYLIYNNGQVGGRLAIDSNQISFKYNGSNSYTGTLYGIYNSAAAVSATVSISKNFFQNFLHLGNPGSGSIYFINNSAPVNKLLISGNKWHNLQMNHGGAEYFIYNSSATQSLLVVSSNSVTNHTRLGASANMYGYYGAATAPGTAMHQINGNLFSQITSTVAGTGNFYGIYSAEGNSAPYPLKTISGNTVSHVKMNGTGNFYGIYATDLGDAGAGAGSVVENNRIVACEFGDAIYGLYCSAPTSSLYAATVRQNTITGIQSNGGAASAFGVYLGGNNAGAEFYRNRISTVRSMGTTGTAQGLYCTATTTSNIYNNLVGHIDAPAASGANKCNGIYINAGSAVNLCYNTVYLSAASTGSNFGSNSLYASSTAGLLMKNNILINRSAVTGNGIAAAYRRSTSTLTNYSSSSGNNLFYAGAPTASNVIFYNGSGYSSLSAFQAFVSPREAASVSADQLFLSVNPLSPNYLHALPSALSPIESGAAALPVSTDADNQLRHGHTGYGGTGTAPDVGADEFDLNNSPCSGASAGTITPSYLSVCAGQSVGLNATGYTPGAGFLYAWKAGTIQGGPYSATVSQTTEFFSGPLSAGTHYFVMETTCTNVPVTNASNEVTVVVHSVPQPLAAVLSTLVCAGDSILLSVGGASNSIFNWSGPGGFYSSSQAPRIYNATGFLSGDYFVELTTNDCTSPLSAPLTVSVSEVIFSVTAVSDMVCAGNSTTLEISGNPVTYTWSTGANGPVTIVSPSVSTMFNVLMSNASGCRASGSIAVGVVDPTVAAMNATVCGAQPAATLAVQVFTPSLVKWFASSNSSVSLASGTTYSLLAGNDATVFADARALWPGAIVTPIDGSEFEPGNMFDVVAYNPLYVNGLDVHLSSTGTHTIEVWFRQGSFSGFESTQNGWSLAGTCIVNGAGQGQLTSLPLDLSKALSAADTCGLYVAVTGGSLICSNTGTMTGSWSSNKDIDILSGNAGSYFSVLAPNRGWEGQLRYRRALCTSPRIPVTLLVAPPASVSAVAQPPTVCPGKSSTLSAAGAASYTWSGAGSGSVHIVNPSTPKSYTVKGATQHGCLGTAIVPVGVYSLPVLTVVASSPVVCPSSPVDLSASGAESFVWSSGAIGSTVTVHPPVTATYTAYGTSAEGCISSQTIAVQTKSVPLVSIQQSADSVCPFEAVALKASGASTYTWLPGNTTQPTTTVFPAVSAVYNAIGTSINSCTNIGYAFVFVDPCTGVPNVPIVPQEGIEVYPNPSANIFNLRLPEGEKKLQVFSPSGSLIHEAFTAAVFTEIDLGPHSAGLYCLLVKSRNKFQSLRLVKE